MEKQLDEYRSQLVLHILGLLNRKLNVQSKQQNERFDQLDASANDIISVLAFNHEMTSTTLSRAFSKLDKKLNRNIEQNRSHLNNIIQAVVTLRSGETKSIVLDNPPNSQSGLHQPLKRNSIMALNSATKGLGVGISVGSFEDIRDKVFDCLEFRQMSDRFEAIKNAHIETFEWLYSDPNTAQRPWSNYPKWLEQGSGCYWINGKAGSGKSTLMKFIWCNEKTKHYLSKWAADNTLLMGSFFFWYLGTDLQKSQCGLLRSLLHQVLHMQPELIPAVMPDLCRETLKRSHLADPSLIELIRWFKNLAKAAHQPRRICFFIDGLDEFSGNCAELNDFLLEVTSMSPDIKFVVSSRPITVCTDVFSSLPTLRVQDITQDDMRRYASDYLGKKLSDSYGSEWTAILDTIVTKASGVFMWVCLVVKSLLEGLRDGDTFSELQERLEELPSDLQDLYQHMLDRIPEKYRQQALQIIWVALLNRHGRRGHGFFEVLSPFQLSMAFDSDDKVLSLPIKRMSKDQMIQHSKQFENRVRGRCLGLLEVNDGHHRNPLKWNVEFIHKTAVEFFTNEHMGRSFRRLQEDTGFNPFAALLKSSLVVAKSMNTVKKISKVEDEAVWGMLWGALLAARDGELVGCPVDSLLIKELDKAYAAHWHIGKRYFQPGERENPRPANGHWFKRLYYFDDTNLLRKIGDTFAAGELQGLRRIQNTSQGQIRTMVSEETAPHVLGDDDSLGLDRVAITFSLASFFTEQSRVLTDGARQPEIQSRATSLLDYLIHTISVLDLEIDDYDAAWEPITKICEVLFAAGADPNASIYVDYTIWTFLLCTILLRYIDLCQHRMADVLPFGDQVSIPFLLEPRLYERLLELFISHNADMDARFLCCREWQTPLSAIRSIRAMDWRRHRAEVLQTVAKYEHILQAGLRTPRRLASSMNSRERSQCNVVSNKGQDCNTPKNHEPTVSKVERRRGLHRYYDKLKSFMKQLI